jgi:hypothetical protein
MKPSTVRLANLAEALALGVFVTWYIWQLQASHFLSWLVFPVWMIASFAIHRDTFKTLGWRADNLWPATKRFGIFFAPSVAALCLVGILLDRLHHPVPHLIVPRHFFGYMAFCFVQQVGLNSYLTNRLLGATDSLPGATLLAGGLFAALHWPNPVLIPLTFISGTAMAWLFARERNIIPLAIGQGVLGTLVWWAFPVAWHHGLRVGPGFYAFHVR